MSDEVELTIEGGEEGLDFEALGHENGQRFWWKSDLAGMLGYVHGAGFEKALGRAIASCTALGINVQENFEHVTRDIEGDPVADCKLSRFACYLTAMNADPSKPAVARAQAYFAGLAEVARQYTIQIEGLERVLIRDEMIERNKSLSAAAKASGVSNYAFFHDAGYRGLYNTGLVRLRTIKGIGQDKVLADFMGKEELAANLFRMTQTEARLKKEQVQGQIPSEHAAFAVGRQVRDAIAKIGGTMPEQLPVAQEISAVRKGLKQTAKELQRMDKKRLGKPRKADPEEP